MKNLKDLLTKCSFKTIGHILLVVGIVWASSSIIKYAKANEDASTLKLNAEVSNINLKIDSISTVNDSLIAAQFMLNKKLDSIKYLKFNEDVRYENEIIAINNSSISDDSKWFLSKIDSLKYTKNFSIGVRSNN